MDIASKWILEIKAQSQFQELQLQPRLIITFLQHHEKNFEKAFARATELNLQDSNINDCSNINLELKFDSSIGTSTNIEVLHICRHYRRLHPTLSPRLSTCNNSQSSVLQSEIPPQRVGTTRDGFDRSSSVPSDSTDDFDFGLSHHSWGSCTPQNFITHNCEYRTEALQPRFPLVPTPNLQHPICSPDSQYLQDLHPNTLVDPQFKTDIAPIPIPNASINLDPGKPTSSISDLLSGDLGDLELATSRTSAMNKSNLANSISVPPTLEPLPSRKRKRDTYSDILCKHPLKTIRSDDKIASENPRISRIAGIEELEQNVMKFKEDPTIGLLKSMFGDKAEHPKVTWNNDTIHETHLAKCRRRLKDIQHERDRIEASICHRSMSTRFKNVMDLEKNVVDNLLFSFNSQCWNFDGAADMRELQHELEYLSENADKLSTLSPIELTDLHAKASRLRCICDIRGRLIREATPLTGSVLKQSRVRLQRRHRLAGSDPVDVLKVWFLSHLSDPYPAQEEKRELSKRSGLQLPLITRWFSAARSRGTDFLCLRSTNAKSCIQIRTRYYCS